jgi:hypothetical protein
MRSMKPSGHTGVLLPPPLIAPFLSPFFSFLKKSGQLTILLTSILLMRFMSPRKGPHKYCRVNVQTENLLAVMQVELTAPSLRTLGAELLSSDWVLFKSNDDGTSMTLSFKADIPGQVFVKVALLGDKLPCFDGMLPPSHLFPVCAIGDMCSTADRRCA